MTPQTTSALSALVIIPDEYASVQGTMKSLEQQTVASQVEIVFIAPADAAIHVPENVASKFHSFQIVRLKHLTYATGRAAGARAASSPIVAFTEDHAFPAPNWAERLIAAYGGPYDIIGSAMRCANPQTLVSVADFYMGYGKWAEPVQSGPQEYLMAHNVSYKRDVLVNFGDALEEQLSNETVMQYELAAKGNAFWLEASTYTAHLNFEKFFPWLRFVVYFGRSFGARRSIGWSFWKRALYILGSPLIPFVRFARIRRDILRAPTSFSRRLKLYLVLATGLMADAFGQLWGYLTGQTVSAEQILDLEFHREQYLLKSTAVPAE